MLQRCVALEIVAANRLVKHHLKGLVTNVGINCLQKGNRRRRDVK